MSDKPQSRYTGPGSALPRPEDKLRTVPMADMDPGLRWDHQNYASSNVRSRGVTAGWQ
jgi:hypothetical protein